MDKVHLQANRANWDERAEIHIKDETGFYAIDEILTGAITLTDIERRGVGDLTGKRVAHFQCHIGTDSIGLKRLGAAEVVGLDFSPKAIAHARELARRARESITYIEGSVTDAPALLGAGFDLVFTSWGTLGWHNDIAAWARAVAGVLEPGGELFFADGHPFALIFDDAALPGRLDFRFDYETPLTAPIVIDEANTYNGSTETIASRRTFEWVHSVSRVLNAIVGAGLSIEAIGEYDVLPWMMYSSLVPAGKGLWRLPDGHVRLPLSWSIRAQDRLISNSRSPKLACAVAFARGPGHDAGMKTPAAFPARRTRRRFIAGLAAAGALSSLPSRSFGRQALDARDLGIVADKAEDQSEAFQLALAAAVARGLPLALPAGRFNIHDIRVPEGLMLTGVPGMTVLFLNAPGPIFHIESVSHVTLDGLSFTGEADTANPEGGLIELRDTTGARLSRLRVAYSTSNGIACEEADVRITDCDIHECAGAAIFSMNGRSAMITGNRISGCGDGGILIWRSANGRDGTIVAGNRINATFAKSGGNGQYGNAINVFRADNVIVADNVLTDCSFTAVRLNSTNDTHVTGNQCINCGEVAIFSEFAFSGSVIANNIVDGAAAGISMTNFNEGGRLAVCSGNIVRNIFPRSEVNPDTVPYGIFAEADAIVSGNVVEAVPGLGIGAGYGPYLRNVHVSDNVVRDIDIGIGVSVAAGAGAVQVVDNHVSGARLNAIVGMAWQDVVSDDLVRDAGQFPQVSVSGNTVG